MKTLTALLAVAVLCGCSSLQFTQPDRAAVAGVALRIAANHAKVELPSDLAQIRALSVAIAAEIRTVATTGQVRSSDLVRVVRQTNAVRVSAKVRIWIDDAAALLDLWPVTVSKADALKLAEQFEAIAKLL